MGNKKSKKKPQDMNMIIMQMKMSAKRFQREANKANKQKSQNLKKAEKALLKGDEQGARLYTQNAQHNINDYRKYLHMHSKLDAMANKMKGNHNSTGIIKHISQDVTPIMAQQADQMDIKSLVQNFDVFQDAFDRMEVNANIMNQNFNAINNDGNTVQQTDELYQQLQNKVQFDMHKDDQGFQKLNSIKNQNSLKDDELTNYINDLKKSQLSYINKIYFIDVKFLFQKIMLQDTHLNQNIQMKNIFILILLGFLQKNILTQEMEIVNIEGFGQPQETILQFLREFGSRVTQQSSKLFLLAQEKKTQGMKLIFLSASTNDLKYIGVESQELTQGQNSRIKTYIESNSLQIVANAVGIKSENVQLDDKDRINYSSLLVNSFTCQIKQPQVQLNMVSSLGVQSTTGLQDQSQQIQQQTDTLINNIQTQQQKKQNRIRIKLPDYTSILTSAYPESLLNPTEEQQTTKIIELNINGKQYRVDCSNLNLPLSYLTNNSNILNQSNQQQDETRKALIQAYDQCGEYYEDQRKLQNKEGNLEFNLLKINDPSSNNQNKDGDLINLYRYSGEIDSVIPSETGPAKIDINRTNKITTTTVTTEETTKPSDQQQTVQLDDFSLDNFDDLLKTLEGNPEGLDVFALNSEKTSLNEQQQSSILNQELAQPEISTNQTKILQINSTQQKNLLEQSASNSENLQSTQGTNSSQQQGQQGNIMQFNNNQDQLTDQQLKTQQQIQDQINNLSFQMANDDSQSIEQFQNQINELLGEVPN